MRIIFPLFVKQVSLRPVFLFSIIFLVSPVLSYAQEYYVASDGNNSHAGTINAPWGTIQYAADNALPGSTVYVRGGTYSEMVKVNVSGSENNGYITFKNYNNELPIIDGSDLTPSGDTGIFCIEDESYIIIDGFEMRNLKTDSKNTVPAGVWVFGASHHIHLLNNKIHDIGTSVKGGNAHGIALYGTSSPASINNILIQGNELYNLQLGWSESMVLNGNVEDFLITENIVRDNDNIGIDLIGFEGTCNDPAYDQARNGEVIKNLIYNCSSKSNISYGEYSAGGIYVDGGRDNLIERNTVYSCDIGIELASEHAGTATSSIIVRNNLLFDNWMCGVAMGGYSNQRGSTEDCIVVNNTLFQNDTLKDGNGELYVQYDTRRNTIMNNIIYSGDQGLMISNSYEENTDNIVDYNLYFSTVAENECVWQWMKTNHTGFSGYQTGTGNDSNSIFQDPGFVNTGTDDFHLLETSAAVNSGDNIAVAGSLDIDGQPRIQDSIMDIGCDEYPAGGVEIIPGDVNGSGSLDLADVVICLQISAAISPDINVQVDADVNEDDKINIIDSVYILRELAGRSLI